MADEVNKNEILLKKQRLDQALAVLKNEFVGIDDVLENVMDSISSWYLFPEIQERPVVINLWGLTGVGKTSLINRLSQLIHYEERYFRFDLGDHNQREYTIKSQLEEIYENVNGFPVMIALDEFQFARTLDDAGQELEQNATRIIWQILDSGKFQISRNSFWLSEFYELILKLRYLLRNGVEVSRGKVVSKLDLFIEKMRLMEDPGKPGYGLASANEEILFVPLSHYDELYSIAKDKFDSPLEIEEKLRELNGNETMRFLNELFIYGNSPKLVDCSKALVFVSGNLDEAYSMSSDYNPDMDADEFYEQSLKISITTIKDALRHRFRNEQISRLGNTHIIFPALNRESYKKLIVRALKQLADKVRDYYGLSLSFDSSVHELIYQEGVFPTQGARPLFTTIYQVIDTRLGNILAESIVHDIKPTTVRIAFSNEMLIVEYYRNSQRIHVLRFKQQLKLGKLRENRRDDLQAITAVHEAGHAIASVFLLHTIPEFIFSNSTNSGIGGFVYTKFKWKYIARREIDRRLAYFLAGFASERMIFGEENVTTGSGADIMKASNFITDMLKESGMGQRVGAYNAKERTYPY
jgi:hypothetical protein